MCTMPNEISYTTEIITSTDEEQGQLSTDDAKIVHNLKCLCPNGYQFLKVRPTEILILFFGSRLKSNPNTNIRWNPSWI